MSDVNPAAIKLPPELEGRTFFTLEEFGQLAGRTPGTIRVWGKKGFLKLRRFSPKSLMVPLSELERYMRGEMMEDCD